jgi:5-oxoprolinase (ATP-hydrolysing) subunit A
MFETVKAAVRLGVSIGAHPSYPDREGFGRRPIEIESGQIRTDVLYQIGALDGIARAVGTRVRSVKAHGALYNRMAVDIDCAEAVARATQDFAEDLWLVVPAGSLASEVARSCDVRVAEEAFCDRRYLSDGTLVPRSEAGAFVTDPAEASDRAVRLARDHAVETLENTTLHVNPSTPRAPLTSHERSGARSKPPEWCWRRTAQGERPRPDLPLGVARRTPPVR